ncbi:ABC1 family protein [Clavispora lusitaniae]|uniref:ABC1 family protein n=1 Tax=Clavispora lusitaniae TaxID=36911 RepID=UPI00202BDB6F|nr:ABC1 family protein [Clavispora lusitaniae]
MIPFSSSGAKALVREIGRCRNQPVLRHFSSFPAVYRSQFSKYATAEFHNEKRHNGHNSENKRSFFESFPPLGSTSIGISSGVVLFWQWDQLSNDSDPSFHSLKPVETAETYEMGLYLASLKEEDELFQEHRQRKLRDGPWYSRIFYRIKFALEDYVIDPSITFVRFLELAAIIFPLIFSSPICWLGRKNHKGDGNARFGARLWYRYLRWSAEVAGPSFIKLGQWAASRTDIFPKELCEELSHLHSNAKAHSFHQTKKILSASFGMPFEEIFDEFNKKPLGVGAIAQVYLAKLSDKAIQRAKTENELKVQLSLNSDAPEHVQFWENVVVTQSASSVNSGQEVAIKVLHPHVEVKVLRDLKIMSFFANMIDIIPTMEWLSLPQEVEQFSILMRLQLDLRIEALNLAKFRHNFRKRLDIHFPKPFLNFSSKDVLVEEYVKAIPMSRMLSLKDNFGKNLSKEISDKGLDSFLQMLLLDNFVHADLHPGNMLVRFYKNELFKHEKEYKIVKSSNEQETNRITEELLALGNDDAAWYQRLEQLYEHGYHAEICFLDVGLVTELNQTDRYNFIDLFKALSEFDGYRAGELMVERSRTPSTVVNKEIFALKVEKLVDRMKQRTFTLGNVSIGDLLDQVLGMVRTHHVRMEGDFITVIVAILLLEGIGRQLDPELDLFASSLPVLRKLGASKEGRDILRDEDSLNMIKVWLALEVRQLIHASVQDVCISFSLIRDKY